MQGGTGRRRSPPRLELAAAGCMPVLDMVASGGGSGGLQAPHQGSSRKQQQPNKQAGQAEHWAAWQQRAASKAVIGKQQQK